MRRPKRQRILAKAHISGALTHRRLLCQTKYAPLCTYIQKKCSLWPKNMGSWWTMQGFSMGYFFKGGSDTHETLPSQNPPKSSPFLWFLGLIWVVWRSGFYQIGASRRQTSQNGDGQCSGTMTGTNKWFFVWRNTHIQVSKTKSLAFCNTLFTYQTFPNKETLVKVHFIHVFLP